MTATDWPPRPPDRVRHRWTCARRGALVEVVKQDATGRARVVEQCQECGCDDLTDRVRAAHEEASG